MRLSTKLTPHNDPTVSFSQVADSLREQEQAGLDIVWVTEAYGFDAPTAMGYLAARTERVQVGSGILAIYTRAPTLLAQTAAGLDLISGGRAILGLGTSGPRVIAGFYGLPYDRQLQRTREVIEICRRAWRREVLRYDGECYTLPLPPERGGKLARPLKLMYPPLRSAIPIFVGALGPKNVELTAEIADGWLPFLFVPEMAPRVWGEALRRGLARRSPDLGPLEIVASRLVAIGDGLEALRDHVRPTIALYAGGMGARGKNFYNDLLCRYGFAAEAATIQDLYLSGRKNEAAAAVPAALVDQLTLVGSRAYVRERLAAYRAAGVTILDVEPIGPRPATWTIEQLRGLLDSL